jgi:predicted transposase/invertase (TIGR01784 family)
MYIYHSRLFEKFTKPIIPIAILSYNQTRKISSHFINEALGIQVNLFNYQQLHLISLNWKNYISNDNPAAAALLSKMNYKHEERVKVRMGFLRMISRLELNPAKTDLLYGFFETYLKLTKEEEKEMYKEISKLPKEEADRVMELPNSFREEGRQEGRIEGISLNKKRMISNMLKKGLSDELIAEIAEVGLREIEEMKKKL